MNTATDYPPGEARASDADRERALGELSDAFQAGRITAAEFDERSGQALRARTGAELTALLADLPRDHSPATRSTAPGPAHCARAARIVMGASAVTAVCLAAVAATNALSSGGNRLSAAQIDLKRQLAQQVLAREGLKVQIPRGLFANPGFDWAGTITPAAIAVVLVVLIIVLARVSRVKTGTRAAR